MISMGHTLWTIRVKAVRYTSLSQSLLSDSRNAHPPQYVILNYLFTFTKQSTYKTEGRRAMSLFWKKRTKTIEKIFVEINDFYLGQAIFGRICVVWNTKMGCQAPSAGISIQFYSSFFLRMSNSMNYWIPWKSQHSNLNNTKKCFIN